MAAPLRRLAAIACTVAITTVLVGCSSSSTTKTDDTGNDTAKAATITVYTGMHKELIETLASDFTKKTGIKVDIRAGEDAEMSAQVMTEGARTKADVYLSEGPGPVARLAADGLFAKLPAADLKGLDPRLVPSTGNWAPYAARARVLLYNPTMIAENALPKSILDLSKPEWKGKFAYATSDGFPGTVSYLIDTIGQDKTLDWLKAIKENGVNEHKNGKIRDTVEAGQHAFGLTNHYYWYILAQTEGGADKLTSKLHYFSQPDAGGLLLASGAGVLEASKHKSEANEFVSWLVSPDGGQKVIAGDDASQFPAAKGVNSEVPGLPELDSLAAPEFNQAGFANLTDAIALIEKAGMN